MKHEVLIGFNGFIMKRWSILLTLFLTTLSAFGSPPAAESVFRLSARPLDPNTLRLSWQIKPGFFLYQDRIQLSTPEENHFKLGTFHLPDPTHQTDRHGRTYLVYRNQLDLTVSVLGENPGEALLNVDFQGCSDDGFCYPPEMKSVKLTFNAQKALTAASMETTPPEFSYDASTNDIEALFTTHNLIFIVLSFFGFGLLLSLTPCVLPMLPVLSSLIIGHGASLTTRKAFFLSLSYVLSMSVTYAFIGAIVALLGENLQIIMQSPWVITAFSLIFILLALSMFNFYELKLPTALQQKIAQMTRHQAGGHYLSASIMGALSTLILSPCVTAPLIGALGYIAHTGDLTIGILALFFLGLGMGTPLLLIGTSAGKLLPKAGQWMNGIKAFFGVLLLGLAIYLMERILPGLFIMILWAGLLMFSGIYLGAFTLSTSNTEKFKQGLGLLLLIYGILILTGAGMGNTNPFKPLALSNNTLTSHPQTSKQVVTTLQATEKAIASAKGQPILIDFYADWCNSCKLIARTILQDPEVQKAMKPFTVLTVDLTENTQETKALMQHFNVIAPPVFLFLNTEGDELEHLRMVGDISTEALLKHLQAAESR